MTIRNDMPELAPHRYQDPFAKSGLELELRHALRAASAPNQILLRIETGADNGL